MDSQISALRTDIRAILAGCTHLDFAIEELQQRARIPPALAPAGTDEPAELNELRDAIGRLWQAIMMQRPDPLTPFWIGAAVPFGVYELIDYMGAASGTVCAAFERLSRYYRLISPKLELRISGREVALEPKVGPVEARRVYGTYAAGIVLARLQQQIGDRLSPLHAELVAPSGSADRERLATWLGAPCSFDHAESRFVFSAETWQRRLSDSKPGLSIVLERYADDLVLRRGLVDVPLSEVRRAVRDEMASGTFGIENIARRLALSERTLQRRLTDAGKTFRQIVGEERRSLAIELLDRGKLSVTEIAFVLGYSEQTAFARAFRRWTGASPVEFRQRLA